MRTDCFTRRLDCETVICALGALAKNRPRQTFGSGADQRGASLLVRTDIASVWKSDAAPISRCAKRASSPLREFRKWKKLPGRPQGHARPPVATTRASVMKPAFHRAIE